MVGEGVGTVDVEPVAGASWPDPRVAAGGAGFDWLVAGLGVWFVGGLYLDGWAHVHMPALESFFTPWHAVLYSGYLAHATALVLAFWRHRRRGARRSTALPDGYRASLVGVFIFFFAGVADMLWHVAFGIESGVEGLISPSHLGLAVGGGLMVTGPLRAALRRPGWEEESWLARMPLVVSLTLLVSVLTFFTEYASPYGGTWVTNAAAPPIIATTASAAAAVATSAECRAAHFRPRSTGDGRRAAIGLLSRNRRRSSAIVWAVA